MSKEQITPEQEIVDEVLRMYLQADYPGQIKQRVKELLTKYGLSAMEQNNRLIADIQDAIGGLFAVIEEHGVDTIIASSGDPGAVKDCLLSAKEVLQRLGKYGLSTPVTDGTEKPVNRLKEIVGAFPDLKTEKELEAEAENLYPLYELDGDIKTSSINADIRQRRKDYITRKLTAAARKHSVAPVLSEQEIKDRVVHELKTWPPFYDAVATERKTFEVRKFDRDYKEGDVLRLREWRPFPPVGEQPYSGRETLKTITYVLRGGEFGIHEGYCVLGLESGWKAIAESNTAAYNQNCSSIWAMTKRIQELEAALTFKQHTDK